ncbi:PH domain-containing protein [Streptomyces sp. ODS28]|uniref:PH domain-containing protein n=1 Tax=Streptomyces sp. ODS28 TaxID=3136688 RepID=UPI0031F04D4F
MSFTEQDLAEDEELLHITRQHWSQLVEEFALLGAIWLVTAVLVGMLPSGAPWAPFAFWVLVLAALVGSLRCWLFPVLKWRYRCYVLTTKRIYKRSGFLTRSSRSIPLLRVNDVSFRATPWQRLLGYGTLSVQSASEQGTMTLRHVPEPDWFQGEIYRAVDDEQRGQPLL